jgi:hypothetical protein
MYSDAAGGGSLAVINGLAKVTGAEMRRACNELLRVDELLEHAIGQLVTAFNSVSEEARRHRHELVRAAAVAPATHAAGRLRAKAQCVANDVNGAVTALQFRDVVGQKLGRVRCELEALERMMQRIRVVSAPEPGLAQPPAQAQLATPVHGVLQDLGRAQAVSPARQELMRAGEVDLF